MLTLDAYATETSPRLPVRRDPAAFVSSAGLRNLS